MSAPRRRCDMPGCNMPTSRNLPACSPCLVKLKNRYFPGQISVSIVDNLDALSRRRALTNEESYLLEWAIFQSGITIADAASKPVSTRRRRRQIGPVVVHKKPVIETTSEDAALRRQFATGSRALLTRMLEVGARGSGCLKLSADECRAQLRMLDA